MSYDIIYKSKSGKEYSSVNITYNYSWFYYHFLDKEKGIQWLYGKKGKDCIRTDDTFRSRFIKQLKKCHQCPKCGHQWEDL